MDQPIKQKNLERILKKNDLNEFLGNYKTRIEIRDLCLNILGTQTFSAMGIKQDKSFLLYGDPGLGKTYAISCIEGELEKRNHKTFVLDYTIGTHGTAYINMGSVNLQKFFDKGINMLSNDKIGLDSIIYVFDECESLMGKRGLKHNKEDDKLLNTLMLNLQMIHNTYDPEYVIFMTNHIKDIDEAAIRSGRIDRKIEFKYPNFNERKESFKYSINSINKKAKYNVIKTYDLNELAKHSKGFNCADCIEIPKRAVRKKALEVVRIGKYQNMNNNYIKHKKLLKMVKNQKKDYLTTRKQKIGF